MTRKTKEAIKATSAIILAGLAVTFLWIYPLNQAGKIVERPADSPVSTDISEFGLVGDSLAIETDNDLFIRGWYIPGEADECEISGTVILIHGLFGNTDSQIDKAEELVSSGFNVVLYDQRGYGRSDGKYRYCGYYEANDLESIVAQLYLEGKLISPVFIWGEGHGASAAIQFWEEDNRVDYIIAENPVLDGRDWQEQIVDHDSLSAPDIMFGLIWWWIKKDSGYDLSIEETDISDGFGIGLVKKEGRLLVIATGSDDRPDNEYINELYEMGGDWLILPPVSAGTEIHSGTLFDNYKSDIMHKAFMTWLD